MGEEFVRQVKDLIQKDDRESLKYILSDQSKERIELLCGSLEPREVVLVKGMYNQVLEENQKFEVPVLSAQQQDKNSKIDSYLMKKQETKEQNFLQIISKINQKLIFEEHFGYPFYDLVKRIISTSGDLNPNVQTVKTMHSQIQILYSNLFKEEVVNKIRSTYKSEHEGMVKLLEQIFKKQCQIYHNFIAVYKNIKKSTEEQQDSNDIFNTCEEVSIKSDHSLMLDQKEYLVALAQSLPIEEFNHFVKNRTYNFLCFGLKKYLTFLGVRDQVLGKNKKQFAGLMSYLTIRFVRKIVFDVTRAKGNGKLCQLKENITSGQIKTFGNEIIDQITAKIQKFVTPVEPVEEEAKAIFLEEFHTMKYQDFVPRKYMTEAMNKTLDPALYTWLASSDYQTLWIQRVKAQRYAREPQGQKPSLQYVHHIFDNYQQFKANSAALWKRYIMDKMGYEEKKKVNPKKKIKLGSLND